MPLLQGAEQAQSPEVVLRERKHQLSKNSVRELLSPSPGRAHVCVSSFHSCTCRLVSYANLTWGSAREV